jgi:hypothetical protein
MLSCRFKVRCVILKEARTSSVRPRRYLIEVFALNPMESISLKLTGALLETSDRCARALGITRAEYIRRAIENMNRESEARARAARLAEASRKVRKESMRVNAEFAVFERDPDA